MALKFAFNFSIIFLSTWIFSQESIWENAEEFIQTYFEPEEEYFDNYSHRIRMIPDGNDEKWQQKIHWENNLFQLGLRIDKSAYTESIQNTKGYLAGNIYNHKIILGDTRIQIGNSLLFGGDYNNIKSSGSILSPGKIKWKISPFLGSETSSNPVGIFVLKNKKETNYYIGGDHSSISSGIRKNGEKISGIIVGYLPNNAPPALSLSYLFKAGDLRFSGETAIQTKNFAQYIQLFSVDSEMKWLGQFRLLPKDWLTASGHPATGFGKSENEAGLLISLRTKINGFTFFGWADMFRQLQIENELPTKSGEDFLSGLRYRKSRLGTIELKVRRKTKVELFNDDGIYVFQKGLKYYYTVTAKNILILKWKYIHLSPSNETGQLLQIQSLKYQHRQWSGVIGAVYFDTENWDSRLYLIEPGLKGEFRIQPYYEQGSAFYSKLNWEINDNNSLSFRYSVEINLNDNIKWKPEMGLQLDIVF